MSIEKMGFGGLINDTLEALDSYEENKKGDGTPLIEVVKYGEFRGEEYS